MINKCLEMCNYTNVRALKNKNFNYDRIWFMKFLELFKAGTYIVNINLFLNCWRAKKGKKKHDLALFFLYHRKKLSSHRPSPHFGFSLLWLERTFFPLYTPLSITQIFHSFPPSFKSLDRYGGSVQNVLPLPMCTPLSLNSAILLPVFFPSF